MFDLDKYLADLILNCRTAVISIRLFLPCLSGAKELLTARNAFAYRNRLYKRGQK